MFGTVRQFLPPDRGGPLAMVHSRAHGLKCVCLVLALALPALGQYEPPADYYTSATGSGATLKSQLHLIISDNYWASLTGPGGTFAPNGSGHVVRSYDDARYALPITDRDPNNSSRLILAYSGVSVSSNWDSGNTWNREHRWPDSLGLNGSGPDYSDLHHLAPCNANVNSTRGNNPFGTPVASGGYGMRSGFWYPGDSDQATTDFGNDTGDVARAVFYMAVRYDGGDSSTIDLEPINGGNSGDQLGDIAALLKWHYRDVPSTFERRRNHMVFSSSSNPTYYQGNRNPFIDRPEFVWSIYGDGASDSRLYVGTTNPGDGASTATLNLRAIVGAAVPSAAVTLNKVGADPAYFGVTAAGVTCTAAGGLNAFEAGNGSRVLTVSLASTAVAGPQPGTITIDNLEVCNQGAGTGSLDGDDVVTVNGAVVGNRAITASAANFGDALVGVATPLTVTLSTTATDDQRTRVRLNAGTYTSGPVSLTVPAANLFDADGESLNLTLTGTFDGGGVHSGSLVLSTANGALSGEGLAAESVVSITIPWSATTGCPAPFADADADTDVDQADYARLQVCFSGTDPYPAGCGCFDRDASGTVDDTDAAAFVACFTGSGPDKPADPDCGS